MQKTTLVTLLMLSALQAAISPDITHAAPLPAGTIPLPSPRPSDPDSQTDSARQTPQASSVASEALRSGLLALDSGDAGLARSTRDSLPRNALDRHILTWAIALSGAREVPSEEISKAATELKGWPGLASLPRLFEHALFFENPPAREVLRVFADKPPQTTKGAITLIRALMETGDAKRARTIAADFWRTKVMDDQDTAVFADPSPSRTRTQQGGRHSSGQDAKGSCGSG
jgi:soluble lytic murein transglycosylase